jgi:predicted regulator of amino acid metabolism with ACT domain
MPRELMVACVDLDSVLLYHNHADGISRLGRVLPRGAQLVELLTSLDYKVIVLTARPRDPILYWKILKHLAESGVEVRRVTNMKPPADAYFDDKAYRIPKNWK